MPTYVYECAKCGALAEELRTVAERKRSPKHKCGRMKLVITGKYSVFALFTPYRAIGRGRPWIKTRAEHLAYLKRNGYEEVGNDRSMQPEMEATDQEWQQHQQQRKAQMERELAESTNILANLSR